MPNKGVGLTDPGGEVVSVTVKINGNIEYVRYATRNTRVGNSNNYQYVIDDGSQIIYNPNTGYKGLAKLMIDL